MIALLGNAAALKHDDIISCFTCLELVRDDDNCPVLNHLIDGGLHRRFVFGVSESRGFIQHKNGRGLDIRTM